MRNKIIAAFVVTLVLSCTHVRADFIIYSYSGTASNGDKALGSFRVDSSAIMDGMITIGEIQNVLFTFMRSDLSPPTTFQHTAIASLSDPIQVDSMTGALTGTDSKITFPDATVGANTVRDSVFIGAGSPHEADSVLLPPETNQVEAYLGDWTVTTAAATPEPASLILGVIGVAGLAVPAYLRRRRASRAA